MPKHYTTVEEKRKAIKSVKDRQRANKGTPLKGKAQVEAIKKDRELLKKARKSK